ncbi:MAG: BatA and WFA domain-containing protein [Labilithrix sp.]|nr:BatA and WFA domain-containing protein [Labilithrix sp.]MBX3220440.1 BatA and WFA domain-containing protein [Labilithrix sp.]
MSFLTILALGVVVLVAAPYLAHRLRRQRADEVPFAPARLVPEAPPKARRRARLEDRSLFAIRAASVVALALLGASPLVRCSRLALSRGGASVAVAIVIDDSMSMRAKDDHAESRFARAKKGAEEILASLREGDAAAIVLAGAPARVGLAATTDIGAARATLESVGESDRATDLDGALAIARTLVGQLPQIDRRVIVLSDLADGNADAPALGAGSDTTVPVWVAMPELAKAEAASDCGILSADRAGGRARVRFACSLPQAAAGRDVQIKDGDKVLQTAPLPQTALGEVMLPLAGDESRELFAVLTGADAVASDDRALVVVESGPAAIAVVGDRVDDAVSTGGAPVVEQALAALHVDMAVRPLPQAPDRREDTAAFAAMLVDDPPGFTPEQRHALTAFVDRGGVLVLALGRRAAAAPLGATFEPFLAHAASFAPTPAQSVDPASGAPALGEGAASLADLGAKGRVTLAPDDAAAFEPVLKWSDGAPLVLRRPRGRGEVWLTTLPFSVDVSDMPLRPGFLSLLDAIVADAKERSAPLRGDVGVPWAFAGAAQVDANGPMGRLASVRDDGALRIVPTLIGPYRLTVDGVQELRVAAPVQREIDLRPRAVVSATTSSSLGGGVSVVDVSWAIALGLLALVAAETVVRAVTRPRGEIA